MENNKGFYLNVFRTENYKSDNGISHKVDEIFVVADLKSGLFKATGPFSEQDAINSGVPVFEVGEAGNRYHFRPKGEKAWTMFGGNFAYSSDGRTPGHPIHIHDRIER